MSLLNILSYPDSRLFKVAKPITLIDNRIIKQIDNMFETMYQAKGIGLAATQVDFHERLIVIDIAKEGPKQPLILINPEVLEISKETEKKEEGCLSIPGIYDEVERPIKIKVKFLDKNSQEQILEAENLLARCILHEIDHLNGKVFIDYLSQLKRTRIKTKIKKAQKINKETVETI